MLMLMLMLIALAGTDTRDGHLCLFRQSPLASGELRW